METCNDCKEEIEEDSGYVMEIKIAKAKYHLCDKCGKERYKEVKKNES